MTSTAMVGVLLSLAAVGQMGFCAESGQSQTTFKDHHRHPALAHVSLQQRAVTSMHGKSEKPVFVEPRIEPREPSAIAGEVRIQDASEQFTRMSCCP